MATYDETWQQLSTVQSNLQLLPATVASATTIAPSTFITFVTGTIAVATITPPVSGSHMLCLIFTTTSPAAFVTTGNMSGTTTIVQNVPMLVFWDPSTAKYYAK